MSPVRKRRVQAEHDSLRVLTISQRSELAEGFSLLVPPEGAPRNWSGPITYFESPEQRAKAWKLHGRAIMAEWRTPWRRPRGWWLYEAGEAVPATAQAQEARLEELGAVTARERRMRDDD